MPKMKTRKTAVKRFKFTGTGKIMRRSARKGHLMINKSSSRRRRLSLESVVSHGDVKKLHQMIPVAAR
ncbi:MAG: 50S ribosomal protein L35 [Armatimonadota bacterium]